MDQGWSGVVEAFHWYERSPPRLVNRPPNATGQHSVGWSREEEEGG